MADLNRELIQQVYSKITDVINVGSSSMTPGNSFLVLANPGIFINSDLDLKNADNENRWADLLNGIPLPSPIYGASGEKMDSLFNTILLGKELPLVKLKPDQEKALKAAEKVLRKKNGDPTKYFEKYMEYQMLYFGAKTEYNTAVQDANNEGTPIPPSARQKMRTAQQQWDILGYKKKVENAIATVNNLQDLDPNNWWQKLRNNFDDNAINSSSGTFEKTTTFPSYSGIFDDKGWTKFTFNQKDFYNQETSKSVDTGGGVSVNYGLWRVSAEANYKKDEGFKKTETTDIKVSVELKRVQINRPWLEALIFRSRAWRWSEGSTLREMISDGADAAEGATPTGVMPLLPTTLIVSRNLAIQGDFSTEERAWFEEQIETKVSVGWGPFSISGHYNQTTTGDETKGHVANNTISNPDPQIIGWQCSVIPKSPNPDPSLPWPSPMKLEHLGEYEPKSMELLGAKHKHLCETI